MAEQLGEAVLKLSVDDQALNAGLQRAKQQAEQTGQSVGQAFSKGGKELQTAANGLQYYIDAQGRARDASGKFVTSLQLQEAGLKGVGAAAGESVGGFDRLGIALGKLGAQIALFETIRRVVVFAAQQTQDLDSASAAVRTLGVNSDELTTRLRALSTELGGSVSVIELTKAAYDVASSGFASAGDATQVLRAASLGAKGGFAELNDVVQAVTGVLNAYGLSADQATNIVDTFLQTQNDGVITVRQYAAEIGNVASIAAASGVSLQELNAAIATATLRGVPVAQTFTGIRQALSSIIKPSEQAKDLARSLGLDYSVAALQSKGFAGVLSDVQAKTGGATDKLAVLLGSVEAQAAVQPLLNDKLVKYNELLGKQAQSSGAAAAAAKINSETISGGLTQIGNGFSNLATTLDKTLKPVFADLIGGLNDILTKLQQVSALSPEKVKAREEQATRIIDTVKQNSPNYNTRAFYGTPLVSPYTEIVVDGKTFKGTITGVRNELVKYLLQKDLEAINKPVKASVNVPTPAATSAQPKQSGIKPAISAKPDLSKGAWYGPAPRELPPLQSKNLFGWYGPAPQEMPPAKPKVAPVTTPTPVDPNQAANIALANQLSASELRNLQDRLKLATAKGVLDEVGIARLEREFSVNEKIRAVEEARAALRKEENSKRDPIKLRQLQTAVDVAVINVDVARAEGKNSIAAAMKSKNDEAAAKLKEAGSNLLDASDGLDKAAKSLDQTLRGGFELLTPQLQREQTSKARAAIQPLVDNGIIKTGIDISTPEKLFRVAGFAESLSGSQQALKTAIDKNISATEALTGKDWTVNLSSGGQATPIPLPVV